MEKVLWGEPEQGPTQGNVQLRKSNPVERVPALFSTKQTKHLKRICMAVEGPTLPGRSYGWTSAVFTIPDTLQLEGTKAGPTQGQM